jgi:putative colanic acid biosynthesis acetyltransferase WcaF
MGDDTVEAHPLTVDLARYRNPPWHDKGRGVMVRALWIYANALFCQNPLNTSTRFTCALLRMFGAKIGRNRNIKPSVNFKSPWFIEIGDNAWIGEYAWLDSMSLIRIGANACISQGALLCAGSHDVTDPLFGMIEGPIIIEDGVWVGARATVLPGAHLASHSIITAGSVFSGSTEPYGIYAGNPARLIRRRVLAEGGMSAEIAAEHKRTMDALRVPTQHQ